MNKTLIKLVFGLSLIVCPFSYAAGASTDWFASPFSNSQSAANSSSVIIPVTDNSNINSQPNINAAQTYAPITTTSSDNRSSVSVINQIQIPQNVLLEISNLKSKYSLNQAQVNSLNQIARSYQYILNSPARNKSEAFTISIRDVAATNCASSRIIGQALDESVNKIELASLDTLQKKNSYESYSGLLDENTPNPQIIESCEDEFSANNNQNQTSTKNNNFQINLNGVIPDQNINSKCLILTNFMEFGSRDSQVFPLQNFLMENGYLEMYPTGFFGRNTEFAVKEWQKRHNIDVKGWVGPSTRGSIAGLTCKNQAAYDKAFKGLSTNTYISTKKVLAKTPMDQVIKTKTITIATTTSSLVSEIKSNNSSNVSVSNNLSSVTGTFFLKRNPINTLYFTYKANTATEDIYVCISKVGENKCESSNNFSKIKQKYEPGNMDIINNNTKWIFNIYYNIGNFGNENGNIYIKNKTSGTDEVYSVKVTNSF
jgi:peptidoglycan hydrolase-like protein with peptidoglycan-binding domain